MTDTTKQTLGEILATRDTRIKELKERYAKDRLGWQVDDGSAEQDLYTREKRILAEAQAAIEAALFQALPKQNPEANPGSHNWGRNEAIAEIEANIKAFLTPEGGQ